MSKNSSDAIEGNLPAGLEGEYTRLLRSLSSRGIECDCAFDDEQAMRELVAAGRSTEAPAWLVEKVLKDVRDSGEPPRSRTSRIRMGLRNLLGGHTGA